MKEIDLYTKALDIVESCTDYTQLLAATKFIDLLEKTSNNDNYIKDLRALIKIRKSLLWVE